MAKIYVDLIQKGLKSIEDVPLRWKEQAQELMDHAN